MKTEQLKQTAVSGPTKIEALNNLAKEMNLQGWDIVSRTDKFKDIASDTGWFSAHKEGVFLHITTQAGWRGKFSISIEYIPSKNHGSGHGVIDMLYEEGLNMDNVQKAVDFYNRHRGGAEKYKSLEQYLSARGKFYDTSIFKFEPEINNNFLKEWNNFEMQYKQVKKAVLKHFTKYTYNHLAEHGKPLKEFKPVTFEQIDNLLGLAYTSTGTYAGLWVCNSGYLMYNDTHHFTGFMINELGEVIAAAEDENENTIFINLSK